MIPLGSEITASRRERGEGSECYLGAVPPHQDLSRSRSLCGRSGHLLTDGEDLDHAHESVRRPCLLIRHEAQRDVGARREIERQPARLTRLSTPNPGWLKLKSDS